MERFACAACLPLLLALCTTLAAVPAAALLPLPRNFRNNGTVTATDVFYDAPIDCLYLESRVQTRAPYAWADTGSCQYLFQNITGSPEAAADAAPKCTPSPLVPGRDMQGNDLRTIAMNASATAAECASECCADSACMAFVFAVAPGPFQNCVSGLPCCYLKNAVPPSEPSTVPRIASGTIPGRTPPLPGASPPSGMRSAVPQGGVGAGSIELRADGTLQEWTIVNQSPAGAAKFSILGDAFFALRAGSDGTFAKSLRTQPPAGLPGVQAMRYAGAHPVGRLDVLDAELPTGVNASLFAYSAYRPGNLNGSILPAIVYTLEVNNTGSAAVELEYMFNLPLALEENMARTDPKATVAPAATTAADCWRTCTSSTACTSFTYTAASGCHLSTAATVPLNVYVANSTSGVPGQWAMDGDCLTLDRRAGNAAKGNASVCASTAGATSRFFTADTAQAAFAAFASGESRGDLTGAYGGMAVATSVAPGATVQLSLALAWFFPNRDHLGQDIGNQYALREWAGAPDVGRAALADADSTLTNITALHDIFFTSSLPLWLQDALVNSLSHIRSAWWTRDGRFRQWEAYDCVNIDSVHNDGERHLPYILFFPEITKNKMRAWAHYAQSNGMVQEQLGCGCMGPVPELDDACGRVMSDVSSMFIMYVLELYSWGNETAFLEEMWPHVYQAAEWQIEVSAEYGIPANLVATYDILGLNKYPTATYNGVFHLTAMSAASKLARAVGNTTFAKICDAALVRGQAALDSLLFVNNTYYAAAQGMNASLMADSFYGQVLAYSAGLGSLVDERKMSSHLATELERNDTPFGLRVVTGPPLGSTNEDIWQMGSPDWASLQLRLGLPVDEALAQPAKSLGLWRSHINDQWNTAGVASGAGLPYITSHYGYHMVAWHLPLALSGQNASLPEGLLTFAPRLEAPYRLPVLLPGVAGVLEAAGATAEEGLGTRFTLTLAFGTLSLQQLAVGSAAYPGAVTVAPGAPATWVAKDI